MKRLLRYTILLTTLSLATLVPTTLFAQGGGLSYNANGVMAEPSDNSYFHYYEQITVKTSEHWVKLTAQPNRTAGGIGWDLWLEVDGNAYDVDTAVDQVVTTNGTGVWQHLANGVGFCQRVIPANTYPPGEPVAHYANPLAAMWQGVLQMDFDESPIIRFDVGS